MTRGEKLVAVAVVTAVGMAAVAYKMATGPSQSLQPLTVDAWKMVSTAPVEPAATPKR